MIVSTNKRANLLRPGTPTTFQGNPTLTVRFSGVRIYARLSRGSLVTAEGLSISTDGVIRCHPRYEIQSGDILELFPKTSQRYRIEAVDEVLDGAGHLVAQRGQIVRDESWEN